MSTDQSSTGSSTPPPPPPGTPPPPPPGTPSHAPVTTPTPPPPPVTSTPAPPPPPMSAPTAPPTPAVQPPVATSPALAPPATTASESDASARPPRGLVVAAAAIAVVTAIVALLRNRSEGGVYAVGTVVGALGLMAIVGGLLWRFRSARAGLIAAMVVGGLGTAANLTQLESGSGSRSEIQQAIDELGLETADGDLELTDAELECLDQSGFEPDDLVTALTDTGAAGASDQLAVIDVVARCAPRALLTATNVEQYRMRFSTDFEGEITTDESRCMLQGIADAETPSAVATGQNGEAFAELAGACLSADTLEVVRDEPGTDDQTVGDANAFDRLAERCRDGSDPACDLLFGEAAQDSEYAVLSEDCAGRGLDSVGICTAGFADTDGNGFMDDESPGWPGMLTACRQGDMLACDFAYFWAELGSEGERVGETCGERRAVGAAATCIALYGEQASE